MLPTSALQHTLAVTGGDPCGVSTEIILKVLARPPRSLRKKQLILIGDMPAFQQTAKRLRLPLPAWQVISLQGPIPKRQPLLFLDCAHSNLFRPGKSGAHAGQAALNYIDHALRLWKQGAVQALVTAPVTKWAIEQSYGPFVGQTEYLSQKLKVKHAVMLFVSDDMRVAILTRHIPIGQVAKTVDRALMRRTLRMVHTQLRVLFSIKQPKLAICGLNPHAGEGGLFGNEEQAILQPVMRQLKKQNIACFGPFAADGFFAQPHGYDAVICWYHDQGLIPFKMAARDRGCQISLGLPLIRTSPDHGSALDLAAKGGANPGAMHYALDLAARLLRP